MVRLTKIGFLLFVGVILSADVHAQQSPQAVFDDANTKLQNNNYQQALSLYHDLEANQNISGALFLNMGITYQRIDSLGKAKYYFLKASQFEETKQRAEQALNFVDSRFSRQSAVLPKLPWDVATDWLQKNMGAQNILLIGIILLNVGVLIFIAHWFLNAYSNPLRISGISVISIALLVIIVGFYTNYINQRYSEAVMVTEEISVLEQPKEDSAIVSKAYEGYTFTVDHQRSDNNKQWSYVRMSNGLYGWIPNSEILIL